MKDQGQEMNHDWVAGDAPVRGRWAVTQRAGLDEGATPGDGRTNEAVATTSEDQRDAMRKELGGWGGGFVVMGILHLALAGFLDPVWGIVLIVLGVLNLIIRYRGMFIVNGIALIVVGLMNAFGGAFGLWSLFGAFQIYWGIKEIAKYGRYASLA